MYLCVRLKKFILLACAVLVLAGFAVKLTADSLKYEPAAAEASEEIFVPVIMYHSLLKDPDRAGDYIVSPDTFKADMKYLQDNGFTTVFVKDLVNYAENGADLPDKPMVVTFDDGYYNIMEYAYRFMRENGLKGVINVVGAYTEKSTDEDDHNPAYSYLTWEEIAELDGSGVFEIGNHTFDMHSMTGRKGCKRLYSENAED
ncbi:MAG: polysaccharide deacetylase family protein, partial [Oscillospiraceae bacterium]|nr:polysaccharide deacetylase family protein [Oscillospiraceae bacterium]